MSVIGDVLFRFIICISLSTYFGALGGLCCVTETDPGHLQEHFSHTKYEFLVFIRFCLIKATFHILLTLHALKYWNKAKRVQVSVIRSNGLMFSSKIYIFVIK